MSRKAGAKSRMAATAFFFPPYSPVSITRPPYVLDARRLLRYGCTTGEGKERMGSIENCGGIMVI